MPSVCCYTCQHWVTRHLMPLNAKWGNQRIKFPKWNFNSNWRFQFKVYPPMQYTGHGWVPWHSVTVVSKWKTIEISVQANNARLEIDNGIELLKAFLFERCLSYVSYYYSYSINIKLKMRCDLFASKKPLNIFYSTSNLAFF